MNVEEFKTVEEEINESMQKVIEERGIISWVKSLFSDEELEDFARDVVKDLERKGVLGKVRDYLNGVDLLLLDPRLASYLPEEIKLDNNVLYWKGEPVAYVNKGIVPIKGKKEELKEALIRIREALIDAEADEAYYSGLEFGKEVAEANEIAYLFGRFWKGVEGKDDLISKTLKNLDDLPELDPIAYEKARRCEEELRKNNIKLKILNELPYVRVERKKLLGIIPRYSLAMNPGYEEFFYNHLGDYSKGEIYHVLKELEEELTGSNMEKVIALRKEFERREGISRGKKLALVLALTLVTGLGVATALYYKNKLFPQDTQPPSIKVLSKYPLQVNISDASGVSKAYALVRYPSGKVYNVTLSNVNGSWVGYFRITEEGNYTIKVVARDTKGNVGTAKITHSFFDKPKIDSVTHAVTPNGIDFNATARDLSGINKIIIEVNGVNYTLSPLRVNSKGDGIYGVKIPFPTNGSVSYRVFAFDPYNQYSVKAGSFTISEEERFVAWAVNNGYLNKTEAESFYSNYASLVNELFPKDSSLLLPDLKLYSKDPGVFKELYRNISHDPRIKVDRNKLLSFASNLSLKLHYYGKVKVLIPSSNSYKEVPVTKPLEWYIGNYSDGIFEHGLPMHSIKDIFRGGNATLINPIIFDFNPIIIKDFEGNTHTIQSKNIARDTWMIVEHLKRTPYVVKHPEMYEAFNVKVKQNAWDILDNPVMHKLGEHYKPTDKVIWETVIIPQWNYYWNSTPQAGNLSKRITVFPWYNSSLLKQWIANDTDRKIALMYFWKIPIGDEIHGIADLDAYLQNKKFVYHKGLDAMRYVIRQMPRVYEDVMSKYPDGVWTNPLTGRRYKYTNGFYWWLADRGHHGLRNAFKQFVGTSLDNINLDQFDIDSQALQHDGINTHLSKNFTYWKLIKFLYGYGGIEYSSDRMKYDNLYTPIAFKAFGIPHSNRGVYYEHYINGSPPYHYAAVPEDIIFGLPDRVLQPLKQGKYSEVLIFPGNGISPIGSPLYGIKKDLEYGKQHPVEPNAKYIEMYLPIRGNIIYLFKGGKKG